MAQVKLIIIPTLIWPLVHLIIFFVRFQRLDSGIILESLNFLPLGFLSGAVLYYFSYKSSKPQFKWVLAGYVLAFPIAFIGSLLGGLIFIPAIGTTIYGIIPLTLGMFFGLWMGKISNKKTKS